MTLRFKRTLIISLAVFSLLLNACSGQAAAQAPDADFSIQINQVSFTSSDLSHLEYHEETLTRFGRDGEEQVTCSGYRLADILSLADLNAGSQVTFMAADGFSAEVSYEQAVLETTLIVLEENGEVLDDDNLPMLAVDGEGGNVWVRGVAEIIVTE